MSPSRIRVLAGLAALGASVVALVLALLPSDGKRQQDAPSDSTFMRLLALIPDRPETRFQVVMIDYERLYGELGVSRPAGSSTDENAKAFFTDFYTALNKTPVGLPTNWGLLSGFGEYSRVAIWPSRIGYGMADVNGYVYGGESPQGYEAVVGDFDIRVLMEKASHCPSCNLEAYVESYAGARYYAWGGDFQYHLRIRLEPPAFDELGRGGRLAVSSHYVMRTNWSAGIEEMIDATHGTGSLADNEDFAIVAGALAQLNSVSAYISTCDQSRAAARAWLESLGAAADANLRARWDPPDSEPVLRPYTLLGLGSGIENGEVYTSLVLVHRSEAEARANVARLGARIAATDRWDGTAWSETFTRVEIRSEGRLLLARLYGYSNPSLVLNGEALLLHE